MRATRILSFCERQMSSLLILLGLVTSLAFAANVEAALVGGFDDLVGGPMSQTGHAGEGALNTAAGKGVLAIKSLLGDTQVAAGDLSFLASAMSQVVPQRVIVPDEDLVVVPEASAWLFAVPIMIPLGLTLIGELRRRRFVVGLAARWRNSIQTCV